MVLEEKEKEREKGGDEGSLPNEVEGGIRLEKSNILILGPTGSGEPPTMLAHSSLCISACICISEQLLSL